MKSRIKVLYTSDLSMKEILSFSETKLDIDVKPFIKVNSTFDKSKLKQFAEDYHPDCVILTSRNAIEGFHQLYEAYSGIFSVLVLSDKIAERVNPDLNTVIISNESNVDSIAEKASERFADKRLLHLNGNIRKDQLKNILEGKGIQIRNFEVYKTELIQPEINISEYDAIAFLSYSGIDSFFSKYQLTKSIPAFAIGENTSQYLRKYFEGEIFTASNTNVETLLHDIHEYFSND